MERRTGFKTTRGGVMRRYSAAVSVFGLLFLAGCYTQHKINTESKIDTTHKVQLEVKPMHITIDINLKVDRALDDFFGDIDKQDSTLKKEDKK
jgi:hypothetical protein